MKTVKSVLSKIVSVLLTEKVIKIILIWALKQAAQKSTNKVDDEVIKLVEEALNEPQ